MAIANYVTIDGKKYRVLAPEYKRAFEPAKTVRRGVLGNSIVSLGPGSADASTSAILFIKYTPDSGDGSLVDLQTAAEKASVAYTDHVADPGKWGQGTFNITITKAEIVHLGNSPSPLTGYTVFVAWMKLL